MLKHKKIFQFLLSLVSLGILCLPVDGNRLLRNITAGSGSGKTSIPLVIAQKGSSGIFPQNTVAAYEQGVKDGADYIECDISITKDKKLVCLNEAWLKHSTNVEDLPEFASKKTTYNVEGQLIEDNWFSIDFTLDELKKLKKRQTYDFRDPSYNDIHAIATLTEFINVAASADRPVGIYPEVKNPSWVNSLDIMEGQRFEDLVLSELAKQGYEDEDDLCFVQCFDEEALKYMSNQTSLPLIMLTMVDPTLPQLKDWSEFATGIGVWKQLIVRTWTTENGYKNRINGTTDIVYQAHNLGLKVHVFCFHNEDIFLAWDFQQDPYLELRMFWDFNVDGYFVDFPASFRRIVDRLIDETSKSRGVSSEPSHLLNVLFLCISTYIFLN